MTESLLLDGDMADEIDAEVGQTVRDMETASLLELLPVAREAVEYMEDELRYRARRGRLLEHDGQTEEIAELVDV